MTYSTDLKGNYVLMYVFVVQKNKKNINVVYLTLMSYILTFNKIISTFFNIYALNRTIYFLKLIEKKQSSDIFYKILSVLLCSNNCKCFYKYFLNLEVHNNTKPAYILYIDIQVCISVYCSSVVIIKPIKYFFNRMGFSPVTTRSTRSAGFTSPAPKT